MAAIGLEVSHIVELLEQYGSVAAVCEHFPLISEDHIELAQAYAHSSPGEIDFCREVEMLRSQTGVHEWGDLASQPSAATQSDMLVSLINDSAH